MPVSRLSIYNPALPAYIRVLGRELGATHAWVIDIQDRGLQDRTIYRLTYGTVESLMAHLASRRLR